MSASSWPPHGGIGTPTVARKDAVLTTTYSIRIKASASKVFDVVLDVGDYESWNTWIPKVTIQSQPESVPAGDEKLHLGTQFTFQVIMDASKPNSITPTELRITDVSTPQQPSGYIPRDTLEKEPGYSTDLSKVYRVAWKNEGTFASLGLKAERFHEVIPITEEECEVRTWEVMGGVLAYTVKWMFSKILSQKFELWCADLKKKCEQ